MATIQDLGKVAYFNKGMYNSETNYEINDVVSYNGSSYVSLTNDNIGNLPTNQTYWSVVALKGDKGDTGKPFVIEKTYSTIEDMVDDYDNMNINDYVMIQGNIEEEENATLWTKTNTEVPPYKWVYLADFSGASGITGQTPNIQIGTVTEGNQPSVTRRAGSSNENPILDFVLKTGATGETGNGILNIEKTSTSGLTDTYTITYTNGNTTTFTVTNGEDGISITNVSKTSTSGLIDTYTITYSNNTTSNFTITNGKGISSITKTATVDNVDTYTITYNDGTTSTYDVTNGEVSQEQFDHEVDKLKMIYNILPTTTGEGTSLTLNETGLIGFKEFDLKGNTRQESTLGTNLLESSLQILKENNPDNTWVDNKCTINNVDFIVNDDLSITVNGTASSNTTFYINKHGGSGKSTVLKAGTYYYNDSVLGSNSTWKMQFNDGTSNNLLGNEITKTYTTDTDISFYIIVYSGQNPNNTTFYPIISTTSDATYEKPTFGASPNPKYPQKVEVVTGNNTLIIANNDSSQSQTLPLNLGTTELCKIDNYQDIIYKNNKNWYIKKEIGKIIFDGSIDETWEARSTNTSGYNRFRGSDIASLIKHASSSGETFKGYCNIFQPISANDSFALINGFANSTTGAIFIYYDDIKEYDESTFRTWLSNNNAIVYYILDTPTYTQITDATLISQLNAIEESYSYDTQTNITQTNYDTPFIINVTAILDLKNIINI